MPLVTLEPCGVAVVGSSLACVTARECSDRREDSKASSICMLVKKQKGQDEEIHVARLAFGNWCLQILCCERGDNS
jgi:hypothetical protein